MGEAGGNRKTNQRDGRKKGFEVLALDKVRSMEWNTTTATDSSSTPHALPPSLHPHNTTHAPTQLGSSVLPLQLELHHLLLHFLLLHLQSQHGAARDGLVMGALGGRTAEKRYITTLNKNC